MNKEASTFSEYCVSQCMQWCTLMSIFENPRPDHAVGSSKDMAGRDEGTSTPVDSQYLNLLLNCSVSEMKLPGFESSSGHKPHMPRVHIHLSFCTSNNFMFTVFAARPELMDLLILWNSILKTNQSMPWLHMCNIGNATDAGAAWNILQRAFLQRPPGIIQ